MNLWLSNSSQRKHLSLLGLVAATEAPALARQVREDHARLRQAQRPVVEHRRFAHRIGLRAPGGVARLPVS